MIAYVCVYGLSWQNTSLKQLITPLAASAEYKILCSGQSIIDPRERGARAYKQPAQGTGSRAVRVCVYTNSVCPGNQKN